MKCRPPSSSAAFITGSRYWHSIWNLKVTDSDLITARVDGGCRCQGLCRPSFTVFNPVRELSPGLLSTPSLTYRNAAKTTRRARKRGAAFSPQCNMYFNIFSGIPGDIECPDSSVFPGCFKSHMNWCTPSHRDGTLQYSYGTH